MMRVTATVALLNLVSMAPRLNIRCSVLQVQKHMDLMQQQKETVAMDKLRQLMPQLGDMVRAVALSKTEWDIDKAVAMLRSFQVVHLDKLNTLNKVSMETSAMQQWLQASSCRLIPQMHGCECTSHHPTPDILQYKTLRSTYYCRSSFSGSQIISGMPVVDLMLLLIRHFSQTTSA